MFAIFEENYGFGDAAALTYDNSLDYCAKSF